MAQEKNNRQESSLTVRKEKTNGTFEDQVNQLCNNLKKIGIPKDVYIDTGAPYESWKKEDIEKHFSKMTQGTSQAFDEQITSQTLCKYIKVAEAYRELERRAIRHRLETCNALHQEKDNSV